MYELYEAIEPELTDDIPIPKDYQASARTRLRISQTL